MEEPSSQPPQFTDSGGTTTPERHSIRQKASLSRFKKTIIWIGIIIIVSAIGYEAFRVFTKKHITPVKQVTTQTLQQEIASVPKDVPDAGTTKPYANPALSLKLSYPDTWKVTETTDQGVRVESPEFSFISNEQGSQTGVFRIFIRKGARASDSKYIGRGYALAQSEKLNYTNPAADQRKDTLITQFGLDEPTNFAYFFIAGNFQLSKGDTLGPSYGSEPETYIISGGYSGPKLTDDMATYTVASDMPTTSNAYKQAVTIISSLQLN